MQQEHGLGARRALVDVVHPQPVGQRDVARREGEPGQVVEALLGGAHHVHGRSSMPLPSVRYLPWRLPDGGTRRPSARSRARVTWPSSAPAWSACPWPTSWPPSAPPSPWSTPRTRAGPPTPGPGSSRPSPAPRRTPRSWPFLRQLRRALPGAAASASRADGVDTGGDRLRRAAASSPSACARTRTDWFAPFAELVLRRCAGRGGRDHAGRGGHRSSRRSARSTASCTRPARPGSTAGAWRPRSAQAAADPGRDLHRRASSTGSTAGGDGGRRDGVGAGRGRRAVAVRRAGRRRRGLDRSHGGVAGLHPAGRPDQGADRAPGCRGRDRRVAHRAAVAHALSRPLAGRAGGLRRHVRDRAPGSR